MAAWRLKLPENVRRAGYFISHGDEYNPGIRHGNGKGMGMSMGMSMGI